MSTEAINKQINETLAAARQRSREWYRAGNTGPLPMRPLREPGPDATRAERRLYERLKAGRARVERDRAQRQAEGLA